MNTEEFVNDTRVIHTLNRFQKRWKDRPVSDIVDDEGHQYVDLVMEGGGVLGIALVGFTYALERAGIRFLGVAGTSAGAINAMLVAAVDTPDQPKSEGILKLLSELDMFEFVDGDSDAKDFVESLVQQAKLAKLAWKGMQVVDNLRDDLGLNPGDAFTQWMKKCLGYHGIRTLDDLEARMASLPKLKDRTTGTTITRAGAAAKLALIAAEITTETKVVFPAMADLFYKTPGRVNPAQFVRASMSIPYFFQPFTISNVPRGKEAILRWGEQAGYEGKLPRKALFLDGGIMSNFPINMFHGEGVPKAPTFGVKLGRDRMAPHEVDNPFQLAGAMFNSARHCLDYDFFLSNPDYRALVSVVDTGHHNWLNFFLEDEDKIDLFARGFMTGIDFLDGFDWDKYKAVRQELAGVGVVKPAKRRSRKKKKKGRGKKTPSVSS